MPVMNLNAGLREIRSNKFNNSSSIAVGKLVVECDIPDVLVNLDPQDIAEAAAILLVAQFKENLMSGRKLDGSPARALAPATLKRREYRRAQGARGGQLAERYRKKKFRSKGMKNWNKRYKTAKLGTFNPTSSPANIALPAVESGLLVSSAAAARAPDGKSMQIFFANVRGLTDKSGKSPAGRALGMSVSRQQQVVNSVMAGPQMAKIVDRVFKDVVWVKKGPSLFKTLQTTFRNAQALASEVEADL